MSNKTYDFVKNINMFNKTHDVIKDDKYVNKKERCNSCKKYVRWFAVGPRAWTGLGKSGHVQSQSFGQISHTSGPMLSF